MRPDEALRRLEAAAVVDGCLDALCEHHGIAVLTVFGSAARGAPDARDVDIAVAFRRDEPDLLRLIDDLSRLTGSDDVDLLDLGRAGLVARERALVDCIPLFEDVAGEFARRRTRANVERMETDWLRRLDLELLAR